jgi:drug/metabolite transporter (DMT)-like permease
MALMTRVRWLSVASHKDALWVWVLTFTPLSKAYLFVALALAVTPLAAALLFDEPLTLKLAVGIVLVLAGLSFVSL